MSKLIMKVLDRWYEFSLKEEYDRDVSPKSHGSRRDTSDEKNIVAAFVFALRPRANHRSYSKAKNAWNRYKNNLYDEFGGLASDLANSRITRGQFINRSRSLFKAAYEKAYRLGTDASGLDFYKLPKEDLRWLKRARSYEYKYLEKFADELEKAKKMTPAYKRRANMYVDTTDSVFDAGRVDAYPNEGTDVFWEMNPAEHCEDCIDLSMGSPYRPDTLPTTPRAGDTKCLSNCKCNLRIRYKKPDKVNINIKPISRKKAKALGLLALGFDWDKIQNAFKKEEAVVLDWNKIDNLVSAMTELRAIDEGQDILKKHFSKKEALAKFNHAGSHLPEWLSPFDREVIVLQKIGAYALNYEGRND